MPAFSFGLYHAIHESDSHNKRGAEYFPSMCFCIWAAFKISFHSSLRNAEMKPAIGNGLTFYCHFSFTNRTHFVLYAQLFFQKRANARASLRSKKRRVNKELVKLSQRKTLSSLLGNQVSRILVQLLSADWYSSVLRFTNAGSAWADDARQSCSHQFNPSFTSTHAVQFRMLYWKIISPSHLTI